MKAGPAWVKSGGEVWRPDELPFDAGGTLTPELLSLIAKKQGRIVLGSAEERRWRLAVPKNVLEELNRYYFDDFVAIQSLRAVFPNSRIMVRER